MEVLEFRDGVDFHEGLEEALVDMEQKTTLGEPGNTSPVMIVIYSDGRTTPDGKRVIDTRVFFDMDSTADVADFITQI